MRMRSILSAALVLAMLITSGACEVRKGTPGTKSNPIRFFFMPLKGKEAFSKNAPIVKKYLEEKTGFTVQPVNSPDFLTIVKAFGNHQADIAFMNTLGYLMARDWAKAEAHLLMVYGDVYKSYRGEILARVGGPINSIADIKGKTIAFSDPFSASGYLYPLKLLNDSGVKPAKVVFANGHKQAVEMVYDGKVDAAAAYHERPSAAGRELDARIEVLSDHPDVMSKLKIVALTAEMPSGPVALSHDLSADIKSKLTDALLSFSRTEEGRSVLNDLYNVSGFEPTNDAAYNGVQDVIKKLGKSIAEMVPGGVTFYNTNISPLLMN